MWYAVAFGWFQLSHDHMLKPICIAHRPGHGLACTGLLHTSRLRGKEYTTLRVSLGEYDIVLHLRVDI